MSDLYKKTVSVTRKASANAGPGTETITMEEMRQAGGILAAFADDEDIQKIIVYSTKTGFVHVYRKHFKTESS